jgi:hypothetical protein
MLVLWFSRGVLAEPRRLRTARDIWFGKLNNMPRVIIECRALFAGFICEKENLLNVVA